MKAWQFLDVMDFNGLQSLFGVINDGWMEELRSEAQSWCLSNNWAIEWFEVLWSGEDICSLWAESGWLEECTSFSRNVKSLELRGAKVKSKDRTVVWLCEHCKWQRKCARYEENTFNANQWMHKVASESHEGTEPKRDCI